MKHRAEWAMLSLGVLLASLSGVRLMRPVAETPWVDWLCLVIGCFLVIASLVQVIRNGN